MRSSNRFAGRFPAQGWRSANRNLSKLPYSLGQLASRPRKRSSLKTGFPVSCSYRPAGSGIYGMKLIQTRIARVGRPRESDRIRTDGFGQYGKRKEARVS